jgi:lipopolysaccharide export LptBFGC system permease protein LptF
MVFSFVILPFILGGMIRESVGIITVLKVTPLVFPYIAGYVLPLSIVTGTVLCYGRLNNDNEYSATQAGGVWPGWTIIPAVFIGFITTLLTLWLNESVLTYSTSKINETMVNDQAKLIKKKLSQQGAIQIGDNHHMYRFPKDSENREAAELTIYEDVSKDKVKRMQRENKNVDENDLYGKVANRIVALDHKIEVLQERDEDNRIQNTVVFKFKDCYSEYINDNKLPPIESEYAVRKLQIETDVYSTISNKRVACWGIGELHFKRKEIKKLLAEGKIPEKDFNKSYNKYTRALHTRLALSFSCLIFSMVGTLLGLYMQHGDRSGRFVAGFGIAVAYFIFFLMCRALADVSGFFLWIPNFCLIALCIYIWKKMSSV